ncbi:cytochrome P450 6d3-like [Anopheles bellator]|uniref:cytochrome P450 6d3-like n=1 Tax=Anopheles bellator TaxID=139047 RepID=UPI002649EC3D|nr:cytochrome P450 6d3-like [Anopheles bellator]
MFVYTIALVAIAIFCALKYFYSYWDRHGIANIKPQIPFGNLQTVVEKKESFGIAINNLYHRTQDRLVGVYLFYRPALLIRDPHLAKRIMVNDFASFYDRGIYCNEHREPLSAHLFALPGQQWKSMRSKLTPIFTSGQLRNMFPTFLDVGKRLDECLQPLAASKKIVDVRDISSRYVLDVIASVFFGLDTNCLGNPDDQFREALIEFNSGTFLQNIRTAGIGICPGLLKWTGINGLPPVMSKFVMDVITEQISYRERNHTSRKDFIQLLIDLRREEGKNSGNSLTIEQCAANVFLFYVAGADTSTAAISYTLHELSYQPEATAKVQREIDDLLESSHGAITYENIQEMKYLDLCVKETLRKYPGLPILNRECTIDYRVPDSDIVIRKGTQIVIPLMAISMDEKYFPDPQLYSPERFDDETKNYEPDAYYPFGVGPKNCIGLRQGVLLTKIGLILMLSKYNFYATIPQTITYEAATFNYVPKGGIPMRIELR